VEKIDSDPNFLQFAGVVTGDLCAGNPARLWQFRLAARIRVTAAWVKRTS